MASVILLNIRNRLITTKEIALEVIRRFSDDHCFSTAASLSYTTLLALVPFATVVFSVLSLFPVSDYWSDTMEEFLFDNFVPAAGDTVRGYIHEFSTQAGKLTAVGLVFLLFSSLSLLATIEDSFNDIWKVTKRRKWFQRLLIYWALLTLGPVLIAVSLSMSSALLSTTFLSSQGLVASFTETLLRYLPIVLELCAFMLFYQAIPNLEVRFSDSFTGALIATILFEITKFGFGFWILNFNSYELIYGALATIPVFFVWVFLCWIVMLVGALISAILLNRREKEITGEAVITS
jgi:membrane protein